MAQMNGTGPDGRGPKTGRGLGNCAGSSKENPKHHLGRGLGKRRHAGEYNEGKKTWFKTIFKY